MKQKFIRAGFLNFGAELFVSERKRFCETVKPLEFWSFIFFLIVGDRKTTGKNDGLPENDNKWKRQEILNWTTKGK